MINILIILMIIVAILLIIVVLIQNPKGGGISSEFGGGSTNQMFGVQKTGDILEKITWGFFAFLVVAALSTVLIYKMNGEKSTNAIESDINVERPISMPSALPSRSSTLPATGAAPTTTTTKAPVENSASATNVPAQKAAPAKK